MNVSVIIAFRETGDGWRTRLLDFVVQRFKHEHPEFEIVLGTDDGDDPFYKTLALNRAVAASSGDLLLLTDADTWVPPVQVYAALEGCSRDPSRWWRPYFSKLKLLRPDTEAALAAGVQWTFDPSARRRWENRNSFYGAPPFLIPRALFDDVGGFDERARGWGQEDEMLAMALMPFYGEPLAIHGGYAVHLHHERIGRSGHDRWPGQEADGPNRALWAAYRKAARNPRAMREIIEGRKA